MKHPRLHQVKASAGSGKTFALTQRFLALLSGAVEFADGPEMDRIPAYAACANQRPRGYSWPEILAVTFTNKAATEMKERLVGALKQRALGREVEQMGQGWSPAQAEHRLLAILSRYQRLNIRTIDSLLHLLLSIFALEAGLPPDFELIFEEDELLGLALDRHLARCETGTTPEDHAAAERLDAALRTLMEVQAAQGFWLVNGFKSRLAVLVGHLSAERLRRHSRELGRGLDLDTDQERMAALLNASAQSLAQAGGDLLAAIQDEGLNANANLLKFLAKCQDCLPFDKPPTSKMAEKASLDECLNKASKGQASDRAEALYARLRDTATLRVREYTLLLSAYTLAPSTALALDLLEDMDRLALEQAAIPCSALPGLVHDLLSGEGPRGNQWGGAPEAFCRLGDRLHHLLVDEFQDTGRDQWAAMIPLAEECLSKNGSLFYVGDVKQAIYGWRGGDASLFDQVAALPGPDGTRLKDMAEPVSDSLPCNWRSRAEIVAFNNGFFTRLADQAEDLADSLLPEAAPDLRAGFATAVHTAFADAAQEMPKDGKDLAGGYVRFERLPGGPKEAQTAQVLEALVRLVLDDLAARRPLSDIAVLVRTGDQAELVCTALLEAGVEVVTEKSLEIARHPVIRQLTALLSWLDFPEDDLALAEVLCGEEVFLPEAGLDRAAMLDWLAGAGTGKERPGPLWRAFRRDFPEVWDRLLDRLMNKAGVDAPYDLLSRAVARFRVLAHNPAAELPVRRFQELVHQAGEHGHGSLTGFLAFWKEHGHEEKAPLPENLGAVRILTMHKAKGLEFPVVVVPFQHWSGRIWNEFTVVEYAGSRFLVRLNSGLGREWDQRQAENGLEQLNLLYVAWTRAREELYGFLPEEVIGPRGAALSAMDLLFLDMWDDKDRVEFGVRPEPPAAPFTPAPAPSPIVVQGPGAEPELPRLRVYSHMDECAADDRMRARLRGDAAHKAMELLRPPRSTSPDDAPDLDADQAEARRAAQAALHAFPVLDGLDTAERETLLDEITAMAAWALSRPELRPALGQGRFEATILTSEDKALRPDLIHESAVGLLVVDFKTGGADRKHHGQVAEYMALLSAMGKGPVSGLLAYLDQQRLVAVEEGA